MSVSKDLVNQITKTRLVIQSTYNHPRLGIFRRFTSSKENWMTFSKSRRCIGNKDHKRIGLNEVTRLLSGFIKGQ